MGFSLSQTYQTKGKIQSWVVSKWNNHEMLVSWFHDMRSWYHDMVSSQVPRLPWMSVGRTNPLRAAFFSSGASSAKNVAFTPPYNIHNWIPLHVTWPRASPKLLKFNSSRSYGRFRCASSLSTRAHYTYLQYFSQFSARICDQRSFCISHSNKSLF